MPSAPNSLATSGISHDHYHASWNDTGPWTGVTFLYREGSGGWNSTSLAIDALSYESAVTEGITFEWKIGVAFEGGEDTSEVASGTSLLRAPVVSSTSVVAPGEVALYWSCAAGTETAFDVYYDTVGGSSWTLGRTEGADATDGTVTGLVGGNTYKFYVASRNSYTTSADSNEAEQYVPQTLSDTLADSASFSDSFADSYTAPDVFADAVSFSDSFVGTCLAPDAFTDAVTFSDSFVGGLEVVSLLVDAVSFADAFVDALTMGSTFTDAISFSDSFVDVLAGANVFSDAVSFSDAFQDAQSIRTDYARYLGDASGNVYVFSGLYKSDNGSNITSTWETIETDLSIPNVWKTVHRVNLKYVDRTALTAYAISISKDGGATWTPHARTVGSGDGMTKNTWFYFNVTSEYFKFKVEIAGATGDFQIIGLDIDFMVRGETRDV